VAAPLPAQTLRFVGAAFGERAEVELAGLDRDAAQGAATAAFEELARAERTTRLLAERAAAAAGGPLALTAAELDLLARTHGFCLWSEGTTSALGGELHRLWGLRAPAPGRPSAERLAAAAAKARCDALTLDRAAPSARLATGAVLDLFPFETGWAVDQAMAALGAAGATNARVAIGTVTRGAGAGPDGRGWPLEPPAGAFTPIYLRDKAAALLSATDRSLGLGGDPLPPYIDLRTGRPAESTRLVAVVTDHALDARALAQAMFVFGPRTGQLFLGSLRPVPAVLWLVGSAEAPVLAESNWSRVPTR
jgi:thiamine biosynthesis lipoprotein ApbE